MAWALQDAYLSRSGGAVLFVLPKKVLQTQFAFSSYPHTRLGRRGRPSDLSGLFLSPFYFFFF